jgi:hypothetical protein
VDRAVPARLSQFEDRDGDIAVRPMIKAGHLCGYGQEIRRPTEAPSLRGNPFCANKEA